MELRPYQNEAIQAVVGELQQHDSTLLVLPTGCGKTVCFAKIAERMRPTNGRALVLAHREELLKQAQEKIQTWTNLSTGIEQAQWSVSGMFMPDVVIGSVQTLSRASRMTQFAKNSFGLIITDEAHHSTSPTYQAIYHYFNDYKHLGVTATPDRLDGKGMGAVFESSAFVYEIRDAIEGRFLVPIRQHAVEVHSLDISKVRTTAGDLNEKDLEAILMEERNLHEIAQPTVELSGERPTLMFCTTVKHAKALSEVVNRYKPGSAAHIDGSFDSLSRAQVLREFATGQIQYLANCALLTEGVDIPHISCVAMARPTKSRALYTQAVGRGTRLHPGKTDLVILDFVGNSGKHSLVCAMDVLDGTTDLEVKARAQSISKRNPKINILEALAQAQEELLEEQRKAVLARARFSTVEVDPFDALGVRPRAGRWGGTPMTEKQAEILDRNGIPWNGLDKGQASQVIDKIFSRREQGLCTVKQAKILMKYGLNPDVPFEIARRQLDAIAQSGWRLTLAQQEQIARFAA